MLSTTIYYYTILNKKNSKELILQLLSNFNISSRNFAICKENITISEE